MNRSMVVLSLLLAATGAFAQQASTEEIEKPLAALPAQLRAGAMVIKWKPADWTYDTLRAGTNNMVCFDKSGLPGQQAFSLECTVKGNLPRAAQNMKMEAMGAQKQAALDAAEKDGTRVKPEYGSVWFHLMGASKEAARAHFTIAVPGATTATTGLPQDNKQGGVWIMNAGTTTAHLMIPGE